MAPSREIKVNSCRGSSSFLAKAVVVGAVAGLAGGWAMAQFSKLVGIVSRSSPQPLSYSSQEWDITSRFAEMCEAPILGRKPSVKKLKVGAALVHYTTAALAGSAYGAILRSQRIRLRGSGLLFGTAVWLAGNECFLPLIGVIEREDYNLGMRVHALGEHLAYGLTVEIVWSQWMTRKQGRDPPSSGSSQ